VTRLTLAVVLLSVACAAVASDSRREQTVSDALLASPLLGKAEWLSAEGQAFLGLFIDSTASTASSSSKAAILLHDAGEHPDQKNVVHGLRSELPRHQWATLSIQMPLQESSAMPSDYYALIAEAGSRIQAAISYLQAKGHQQIVLIGYGMGSVMALHSIDAAQSNLAALVAISLPVVEGEDTPVPTLDSLRDNRLPLLDIYSEFDLPTVVNTATARQLAAKNQKTYRQVVLVGDDHRYHNDDERLIKRIYSWLYRTVP
jgi:predicted esterase